MQSEHQPIVLIRIEVRRWNDAVVLHRSVHWGTERAPVGFIGGHGDELQLALVYHEQRRYAEAEPLVRHAYQGRQVTYGEEHPLTLSSLNTLMWVLTESGQNDEADAIRERILDLYIRVHGEEHGSTLTVVNDLAVYYVNASRYEEAEPFLQHAVERGAANLAPDSLTLSSFRLSYGHYLLKLDRFEQAEQELVSARSKRSSFSKQYP